MITHEQWRLFPWQYDIAGDGTRGAAVGIKVVKPGSGRQQALRHKAQGPQKPKEDDFQSPMPLENLKSPIAHQLGNLL